MPRLLQLVLLGTVLLLGCGQSPTQPPDTSAVPEKPDPEFQSATQE